MFWRVLRRSLKLFHFGSRGGGGPQVKGECLLGLAAFGQREGGRSVFFCFGSITAARAGTAEEELNFTSMLA